MVFLHIHENRIFQILKLGLEPGEIIYANPCKPRTFIQHARRRKVLRMTFDSPAELDKIAKCYPEAELILRIAVANPSASFELSKKYGADPALSLKLLRKAKELGLKVIGISFHVGSRSQDPSAYERAIQESRGLFEVGQSMGHEMTVLNVGGGFPGDDEELFKKVGLFSFTSVPEKRGSGTFCIHGSWELVFQCLDSKGCGIYNMLNFRCVK